MIEELQLRKKSNADMYTFNSATLETEFWIDVDLISVGGNSFQQVSEFCDHL